MTLVGFPDFQEQAQWQSPPAVITSTAINTGVTVSFPQSGPVYFNVSNWNATQLRLSGAQRLDVECVWYDAIPAVAFLARSYFTTSKNIGSVVSLPNAGPYLQVNVTNLSGINDTLTAVIAFTNRRQQPFIIPTSAPLVVINGLLVPNGTNTTVESAYLYGGPAALSWTCDTVNGWLGTLYGMTSDGTALGYGYFGPRNTAGGQSDIRMFEVLPRPLAVNVNNFSGGAISIDVKVTPDGFR